MSVTEPTSTAWCQRDTKMDMLMLHHFLNFPTGRGYGRYSSEGARPHDECSGFTGVHRLWLPPEITGARATEVGLRVAPSRLVSLARCCCGGFWAATHLPPCSQFSDVP